MSRVPVTMPQLGETVAEGTVSRWLVEVGGRVRAHEPLLEVSTDKVDTEVAAPVDGVLASVAVAEDETVPVGTVLATVETEAGAAQPEPDPDRTGYGVGNTVPVAPVGGAGGGGSPAPDADRSDRTDRASGDRARVLPAASAGHRARHRDSPRVRRLARERGVDLATVARSGPHGRATVRDVVAAQRAREEGGPAPVGRRAAAVGEAVRPPRVAAPLTTVVEVDLTGAVRARAAAHDAFLRRHDAPLTVLAFVAEAAVRALRTHPVVNVGRRVGAGVTHPPEVHLGIAVDTDEGPVVPVVRNAGDLSVGGLARRIAELAARCRGGRIDADELSGGTFTVTDTGAHGVLVATPVLDRSGPANLGVGAVVRRAVVVTGPDGDEHLAFRSMAHLALTHDHRTVGGAAAARYLGTVKQRLERIDGANVGLHL
jgi:2-oxoglutarate dehydrogenase E2 component (dihydrolipoamide succinyltransferase)